MGLQINIESARFNKMIDSTIPAGKYLRGYWDFSSDDISLGATNKVTGVEGALVGNPTMSNGAINIDKANGLVTDLQMDGEKTFVTVARTSTRCVTLGSRNYDDADEPLNNEGIGVFDRQAFVQMDAGIVARGDIYTDLTQNHFVAGVIENGKATVYWSDVGSLQSNSSTTTKSTDDPNNLRIGGWGVESTALIGSGSVYTAMAFDKALNADEIQRLFSYLSSSMSVIID